jgi:hypothetical protein
LNKVKRGWRAVEDDLRLWSGGYSFKRSGFPVSEVGGQPQPNASNLDSAKSCDSDCRQVGYAIILGPSDELTVMRLDKVELAQEASSCMVGSPRNVHTVIESLWSRSIKKM